jgi:L-rhamnose mutarotase
MNVHLDQEEEYKAWEESLFQEMVDWVEKQGSEYTKIHWLTKSDNDIASVWCETEKGEEITLPEKYWNVATKN